LEVAVKERDAAKERNGQLSTELEMLVWLRALDAYQFQPLLIHFLENRAG
jgi:hypothetical protein